MRALDSGAHGEVFVARRHQGFEIGSDAESTVVVGPDALTTIVKQIEDAQRPRWVWADSRTTYHLLRRDGGRVDRATDLRLTHRILANAVGVATGERSSGRQTRWDLVGDDDHGARQPTLLDEPRPTEPTFDDIVEEHRRQQLMLAASARPGPLELLLRAESAGALAAVEMHHTGIPWSAAIHDRYLVEHLGPRPPRGQRPVVLQRLAAEIQAALAAPSLNPDSPSELLNALRRAGLDVSSTRTWELGELTHPVAEPLLTYKRLSRLHSANGWSWLDTWVVDGRFHPDYVPGGVVTGRWATTGGGAMQIPKALRRAVVAEPGWRLIVADVAQLEPRMLAAMSGDRAMISACRHEDLYQDFVDRGVVRTRQQAKIGLLGALYGGTTGVAAEVLPRLRTAFPSALAYVDEAARAGERFERVSTWLGRVSPSPGAQWIDVQQAAYDPEAGEWAVRRARSQGRSWGRFTRNFVVQGTAAEWALCWMAATRRNLQRLDDIHSPELVSFLHDEIIVHAPAEVAGLAADSLRAAADEATRLMFGPAAVPVPLHLDIVASYAEAI